MVGMSLIECWRLFPQTYALHVPRPKKKKPRDAWDIVFDDDDDEYNWKAM